MSLSQSAKVIAGKYTGEDVNFHGCSIDSRIMTAGGMFIALHGENVDGHDFVASACDAGAVAAMVERQLDDVDLPCLLVRQTRQAMGQLAAHWRARFDLPVVGVTGSNGKTTVKSMLASICSRSMEVLATEGNLNNELGVPLTLFQLQARHGCAVVEMGAAAAGDISYLASIVKPDIAVVTQCAPAHLQGFGSIEDVAHAKGEIFSALPDDGVAVINIDDKWAPLWESLSSHTNRLRFGKSGQADIRAENIKCTSKGSVFTLITPRDKVEVHLPLPGQHNVMNALAATACAYFMDMAITDIVAGLGSIKPVPGRLQAIAGINGSTILDDSYNANPESLLAGLKVLQQYDGQRWLILGEMAELGQDAKHWHKCAGEYAKSCGVHRLMAVGELAAFAAHAFGANGSSYPDCQSLLSRLQNIKGAPVILVKGSRMAGMDVVVQALHQRGH